MYIKPHHTARRNTNTKARDARARVYTHFVENESFSETFTRRRSVSWKKKNSTSSIIRHTEWFLQERLVYMCSLPLTFNCRSRQSNWSERVNDLESTPIFPHWFHGRASRLWHISVLTAGSRSLSLLRVERSPQAAYLYYTLQLTHTHTPWHNLTAASSSSLIGNSWLITRFDVYTCFFFASTF